MNKAQKLKEWVEAEKHLEGQHNQKRHGWRYGSLTVTRRAMRSGVSEDYQGKTTPEAERDAYRKKVGMAEIDRNPKLSKMTLQEYHDKIRAEFLKDNPGMESEYDEMYKPQDRAQDFVNDIAALTDRGETISARTLDDIAVNIPQGERIIGALRHDHPDTAWPKGYLSPAARKAQLDLSKNGPKFPKMKPQPKNEVSEGIAKVTKMVNGKKREVDALISADELRKVKPEKVQSLTINGKPFTVRREDTGWDKAGKATYVFSIKVSPVYNRAAGFTIKSSSIAGLLKELEKIDYEIVPVSVGFL